MWFALTLHGLNIKVSIDQVLVPLVIALGGYGSAAQSLQQAIPQCRAMSHLRHNAVKFICEKPGQRFQTTGAVAHAGHDVRSDRVGWHSRQLGREADHPSMRFTAQVGVLYARCTL